MWVLAPPRLIFTCGRCATRCLLLLLLLLLLPLFPTPPPQFNLLATFYKLSNPLLKHAALGAFHDK